MIAIGVDDGAEAARFWRKVDRRSRHECWSWLAARTSVGYGSLRVRGATRLAHRIAWALTFGPIPPGTLLRHSCHNRRSVNPWHLVPGTMRVNHNDRARARGGARKSARRQVDRLRMRTAAGERPIARAPDRKHGVHPTNTTPIA